MPGTGHGNQATREEIALDKGQGARSRKRERGGCKLTYATAQQEVTPGQGVCRQAHQGSHATVQCTCVFTSSSSTVQCP